MDNHSFAPDETERVETQAFGLLSKKGGFRNAFISFDRITLGPYRKCPGMKRLSGAPQRSGGALSIRALEGSRWHDGAGGLMLWVLNVGECVQAG